MEIDRAEYARRFEGFWLGQSIANWTGLITEMDKIGGEGVLGEFYTREDWGGPDDRAMWAEGPSPISPVIDFVLRGPAEAWGADDDTDIEYMYVHKLHEEQAAALTPEMIRDAWLKHIYDEKEPTPFGQENGVYENYLWVSNQSAYDLMKGGVLPPDTSDPARNPNFEMIDAQLTTEIFGLFAPGRPADARDLARLPVQTSARGYAEEAAQFYVTLFSLAAAADPGAPRAQVMREMAAEARRTVLSEGGYPAAMYDFVLAAYERGDRWEDVRDALQQRYQIQHADGYDVPVRHPYCNGCFASGINFGASLISYFYGEGDFRETVKIATLAGWDSDNPAATWGALLGFMMGPEAIEAEFGKPLSRRFHIHRTRRNFPNDGYDDFAAMAARGVGITDRFVTQRLGGTIADGGRTWRIPAAQPNGGE